MEVNTQLANFFLLHLNPYEVYHGHFFLKKELNLMLFNQCLITSAFKGGLLRKKILIRDKQQWSDCLLEKELHGDEVV